MSKTKLLNRSIEDRIHRAASIIQKGGIVSYPTETYYGLGVDPFNGGAVEKLFAIKGRGINKAVSVIISDIKMLSLIAERTPNFYLPLIKTFWPGPLTLVFPANKKVNPMLTGGTGTIGVRISSHPVATELCNKLQRPLTATSANISGREPAKNRTEVFSFFGKNVDFIIDGGTTKAGLCSTIIGFVDNRLILHRQGEIPIESIQKKAPLHVFLKK